MMDPRSLKKWLIIIAVLYLVFPRDLIPDFLGSGLGLIDDLSLIALLTYFYRNRLREYTARTTQESGGQDERERSSRAQAEASESSFDWASTLRHPEKRFKPPTKPACMNTIQTR
jgi:uncharacterized membrane protein YkvA (DUF1232 family)